ncbi:MAG: acyl carrier protein [Phycisphaerales bacterium]
MPDSHDAVLSQTCEIIGDALGREPVPADASPETIEEWDSIAHLNIVMSLEAAFGVTFDPEEIAELVTPEAIATRVEAKR